MAESNTVRVIKKYVAILCLSRTDDYPDKWFIVPRSQLDKSAVNALMEMTGRSINENTPKKSGAAMWVVDVIQRSILHNEFRKGWKFLEGVDHDLHFWLSGRKHKCYISHVFVFYYDAGRMRRYMRIQ